MNNDKFVFERATQDLNLKCTCTPPKKTKNIYILICVRATQLRSPLHQHLEKKGHQVMK